MKRIKFLFICLQSILLLSAASWTYTTVGYGTNADRPVVASDSMGYLHIAFTTDDEDLQYVTNQSGDWAEQIRIANEEQIYVPTLAVNKYGFTAIAARYYNWSNGHNIYTYDNIESTSVSWTKSVGMGWDHYHECAVEIDSENGLHVCAQEDNNGSYVYYQTNDAGNRIANTLTSQYFATAITPDDSLFFLGSHDGNIWLSKYNGSSWTAMDSLSEGGHPSIISDSDGNLHIAFYTNSGALYYMNNTTGSWSTPSQFSTGGLFPDVVIDANGKAHIAYSSGSILYYTNNMSGSWSTEGVVNFTGGNVTHVERKIALDLKSSTVNIIYVTSADSVVVASTDDYELRASVSNDITTTCTTLASSVASDTVATNSTDTLDILEFSIKDLAGDGLATNIQEIIFQKGPAMDSDICFNDIFGTLQVDDSDGGSTACTIYGSKVFVGNESSTWKSVTSNDSLNFTLRGVLKSGISGVDSKKLQFKINGLNDIIVASNGSQMSRSSSSIVSDTLLMDEPYAGFEFDELGNDFANEHLGTNFILYLYAKNGEGGIASNFNESVTLSAVQLDGSTPASSSLASTDGGGLTKTANNGTAYWFNLTYPTAGEQFRIKAVSNSIVWVSDTVTCMPYRENLLITNNDEIKTCLDDLNVLYDHFDEDNDKFLTDAQLNNYDNLLLFTSSAYKTYVDSVKIRTFLGAGSASERNNVMAMGSFSLGDAGNSPFARDLFAGTFSSGFTHNGDGINGVSQDPISHGLQLSIAADKALYEITKTSSDSNYVILNEDGTGNCVGVKRRNGSYRTILMTPNFWDLTDNTDRDSLISKSMSWLTNSTAEVPLPISLSKFTASQIGGAIELNWTTECETENAAFLIYRNNDLIGWIEGAGTTSECNEYSFLDELVIPGKSYTYILADVDLGNNETRHENMTVTITGPDALTETGFILENAFPNPFNPTTKIHCRVNTDCDLTVKIYDLLGKPMTQLHDGMIEAGDHYFDWNAKNMNSGVYIVRVQADDFLKTQKLVLLK